MHALLALPEPPTAVFAASDMMAFGALKAIRDAGLRCPDDVAVVGFDDVAIAGADHPGADDDPAGRPRTGRRRGSVADRDDRGPADARACAGVARRARRPRVVRHWPIRRGRPRVRERRGGLRTRVDGNWRKLFVTQTRTREEARCDTYIRSRGRGTVAARCSFSARSPPPESWRPAPSARTTRHVTLRVSLFGDFGYHDLYKAYEASHPDINIIEDIQSYRTTTRTSPSTWRPGPAPTTSRRSRSGSSPSSTPSRSTSTTSTSTVPRRSRAAGCPGSGGSRSRATGPRSASGPTSAAWRSATGATCSGRPACPSNRAEVSKLWPTWQEVHRRRQALPGSLPEGRQLLRLGEQRLQRDDRPAQPGVLHRDRKVIASTNPKVKKAWT